MVELEESAIKSTFDAGNLDGAAVHRKTKTSVLGREQFYVVIFYKGKATFALAKQRGGVRRFAKLYSAANVIERVGFKSFVVSL